MDLFWKSFLRHAARKSTAGSIRQLEGVEAAWVHSTLLINNGTCLTSPVSDEGDLRRRVASACEDAGSYKLPWAFYVYDPYLGTLPGEQVAAVFAEFGLARIMGIEAMTGDMREMKPPVRPLPDVEFRRITNRQEAWIALDLNLRSYEMPVSMADSVLETNAYFSDPRLEFGYIAFADGTPVSTATVIDLDGWLYVALVATDPDHRQRGYAEAAMRHALGSAAAALQLSRTALDASAMGAPLYRAMGYRSSGETWGMYTAV